MLALLLGSARACDPGFTGAGCTYLAEAAPLACGDGGLCLPGESTWGGSVLQGDDGQYHMFSSFFTNNCTLDEWVTNSIVLHAVASRPEGPYAVEGVALSQRSRSYWDGLTAHNPAVARAPDGTWLLYHMGTTLDEDSQDCRAGPRRLEYQPPVENCNQRIGLVTAPSPYGPWARRDAPVLEPGPAGAFDDLFTTNPAPYVFPNGSVLLAYKARSKENTTDMTMAIAFAEHWNGTYVRRSRVLDLPGEWKCEDPALHYDKDAGLFRMILHCLDPCSYLFLHSADGLEWTRSTDRVPFCNVTYTNGHSEEIVRRERPQFIHDRAGRVTHLITAVLPSTSHDGLTFTMIEPLVMPESPKTLMV